MTEEMNNENNESIEQAEEKSELVMELMAAAPKGPAMLCISAADAIELMEKAVQKLREIRAAIDGADFSTKAEGKIAMAEYREITYRLRYLCNAMRGEVLDVRDEVLSKVSADRTGNKVDAAERNVQKAIYRLAVVKVNSGRELSEYEQSIYDMFEAEKEAGKDATVAE